MDKKSKKSLFFQQVCSAIALAIILLLLFQAKDFIVAAVSGNDSYDVRLVEEDTLKNGQQVYRLFKNNEDYMKGKKSIRRNQDGRNRFDQSLDVLSELAKVSDYAKDKAETLVDRINEVRKTKPGDRNGVSLSNYGADKQAAHVNEGHQRSVVEAAKRQQKQANNPQAGV